MSEVTLSIGGRRYTVACSDGEETHVVSLGSVVDEKLRELGENAEVPEAQRLLFGALLLADDLHETKSTVSKALEAQETMGSQIEEAKRETDAARNRQGELEKTIAERESELESFKTAQQEAAREVENIRSEVTELRAEIDESRQAEEKLRAELADLKQERDTAVDEAEKLRTAPTGSGFATIADDPDLAPALEKFADLLEECAAKLEGKAAS